MIPLSIPSKGLHSALLAALVTLSAGTSAQVRMLNQEQLRLIYQVDQYDTAIPHLEEVKIAVLDNGFLGYQAGRDLLPESTQLVTPALNVPINDSHGLGMAQILWGLTSRPLAGPQFYLVNTQGFTNFKAAIDFVVSKKVDIVVYSQNWFFGSNFGEGQSGGFINAQVDRAIDAGAIWLNSAGNNHNLVFGSDIRTTSDSNLVKLPGRFDSIRFENNLDSNPVTITLTWNDFQDSETYNTKKDLDVVLANSLGTAIAFPNKVQKGEAPGNDVNDLRSSHARETATLSLDAGKYVLNFRDISKNFARGDRLRVTISSGKPGSVRWLDGIGDGANFEVMAPADNPRVIAVGDCSEISARVPVGSRVLKPDVVMNESLVRFSDGNTTFGSSNATALLGGVVSLLKARDSRLNSEILKNYIGSLKPRIGNNARESCQTHRVWKTPDTATLLDWIHR